MAAQLARARAKARPWRAIIALVLAIAVIVAVQIWGHPLLGKNPQTDALDHRTGQIITYGGAVLVLVLGLIAIFELTGKTRDRLQPVIGSAHAGVLRYALLLIGVFLLLLLTFDLANIPVAQLLVGGAVTGVLLGIAAQQSLANLFAGLVLLFARPFRVGEQVRFRSGALGGVIEGAVTDISLTYVRVASAEGVLLLPNSQVLAAVIGSVPASRRDSSRPADNSDPPGPGTPKENPGGPAQSAH